MVAVLLHGLEDASEEGLGLELEAGPEQVEDGHVGGL